MDRVESLAAGVVVDLDHLMPLLAIVADGNGEVAGVETVAFAARAGVADREALDAQAPAEIDLEPLSARARRAPFAVADDAAVDCTGRVLGVRAGGRAVDRFGAREIEAPA